MSKTTTHTTHKPQRSHDDAVEALLAALRQITKAQGFGVVAEKAGVPRESIYRALSPSGNPRITTLLGILKATGLKLTVQAA